MTNKGNIQCIIIDDEPMAREIMSTLLLKFDSVNILGQFSNALEAFQFINNQQVDLIFLDINMPNITGISFAKSISKDIKIIFTTAYRDYAVEGFELQAVDYLLKPISIERLSQALNRFSELSKTNGTFTSTHSESQDFIFVRSNRQMLKIDFTSIIYVESYSDYIKIHTTSKVITTRETISSIESKLPTQQFIRIHRSYIISMNEITSYTNEHITIDNNALPISRSYKKEVLKRLERY